MLVGIIGLANGVDLRRRAFEAIANAIGRGGEHRLVVEHEQIARTPGAGRRFLFVALDFGQRRLQVLGRAGGNAGDGQIGEFVAVHQRVLMIAQRPRRQGRIAIDRNLIGICFLRHIARRPFQMRAFAGKQDRSQQRLVPAPVGAAQILRQGLRRRRSVRIKQINVLDRRQADRMALRLAPRLPLLQRRQQIARRHRRAFGPLRRFERFERPDRFDSREPRLASGGLLPRREQAQSALAFAVQRHRPAAFARRRGRQPAGAGGIAPFDGERRGRSGGADPRLPGPGPDTAVEPAVVQPEMPDIFCIQTAEHQRLRGIRHLLGRVFERQPVRAGPQRSGRRLQGPDRIAAARPALLADRGPVGEEPRPPPRARLVGWQQQAQRRRAFDGEPRQVQVNGLEGVSLDRHPMPGRKVGVGANAVVVGQARLENRQTSARRRRAAVQIGRSGCLLEAQRGAVGGAGEPPEKIRAEINLARRERLGDEIKRPSFVRCAALEMSGDFAAFAKQAQLFERRSGKIRSGRGQFGRRDRDDALALRLDTRHRTGGARGAQRLQPALRRVAEHRRWTWIAKRFDLPGRIDRHPLHQRRLHRIALQRRNRPPARVRKLQIDPAAIHFDSQRRRSGQIEAGCQRGRGQRPLPEAPARHDLHEAPRRKLAVSRLEIRLVQRAGVFAVDKQAKPEVGAAHRRRLGAWRGQKAIQRLAGLARSQRRGAGEIQPHRTAGRLGRNNQPNELAAGFGLRQGRELRQPGRGDRKEKCVSERSRNAHGRHAAKNPCQWQRFLKSRWRSQCGLAPILSKPWPLMGAKIRKKTIEKTRRGANHETHSDFSALGPFWPLPRRAMAFADIRCFSTGNRRAGNGKAESAGAWRRPRARTRRGRSPCRAPAGCRMGG